MNRDDQFEQRLSRQSAREVPSAWREEILEAARAASAKQIPRTDSSLTLRDRIVALFWPHPKAWAALASIWIALIAFQFATRDTSDNTLARRTAPPSRQMRELLQEKERMFAELIGPNQETDADRPKSIAPHSRRCEEFIRV